MPTRKSAINYERRLEKYIEKHGFFVTRTPASGSRNKEYKPDIIAIRKDKVVIIEVKDTDNELYIDNRQVEGLKKIREITNAVVLICKKRECCTPEELQKTRNGNYKFISGKNIDVFLE
jgi:Holliday junction resolvase